MTTSLRAQWETLLATVASRRDQAQHQPFGQVAEHLFCGSLQECTEDKLSSHNISVVINAGPVNEKYVNIPQGEVNDDFINNNANFIFQRLEECREKKQRAILVCASGVNKAATLAAVYLMSWRKSSLLSTVQLLNTRLGPCLSLDKLRSLLITWAEKNGRLDPPETWSKFDEMSTDVGFIGQPWKDVHPIVFQDDAVYSRNGNMTPQRVAELAYQRTLQFQQHEILIDASACASDGDESTNLI